MRSTRAHSIAVVFILALFALGSLAFAAVPVAAHGDEEHDHSHDGHGHDHIPVTVPDDMPVPTIDITIIEDPLSGWNLHVLTTQFRWAPEFAGGPVYPGEGHAHLYINGEKVARLYGPWYHIAHLEPGANEIRVTLNANNHGEYLYEGEVIADSVTVYVGD
ncbi:MAG: hypothetical protein H0Z37_06005 [Firmicutes bacterium]|nr:hypothetical protein [Bacillota bacterium]